MIYLLVKLRLERIMVNYLQNKFLKSNYDFFHQIVSLKRNSLTWFNLRKKLMAFFEMICAFSILKLQRCHRNCQVTIFRQKQLIDEKVNKR